MFSSLGHCERDYEEDEDTQRKKVRRVFNNEPVIEMDKLRVTVLAFKNIQFTNDNDDSYDYDDDDDEDEDSMDEDDHDNAKFRRILSAHVGIRPVPSRHETVRVVSTSSKHSVVYPASEGYVLSLGAEEKELVNFEDKKDRTNEVGTAFHWCETSNIEHPIMSRPNWNVTRYHQSEYRNCSPSPHLEIDRRLELTGMHFDCNHETVIDFQVCVLVRGKDGPSSYACCHGFGQFKFATHHTFFSCDSPGGIVANVSITKRKAPSFFPKLKKGKSTKNDEAGLRFSRGSSLLIRIERVESAEMEEHKTKGWQKIIERDEMEQESGCMNHHQLTNAAAFRTAYNDFGSRNALIGGAETQPSTTLQNEELPSINQGSKQQEQSFDVDLGQRYDKENVDNFQEGTTLQETSSDKLDVATTQLFDQSEQENVNEIASNFAPDTTTRKESYEEARTVTKDAALSNAIIPTVQNPVQNHDYQKPMHGHTGNSHENVGNSAGSAVPEESVCPRGVATLQQTDRVLRDIIRVSSCGGDDTSNIATCNSIDLHPDDLLKIMNERAKNFEDSLTDLARMREEADRMELHMLNQYSSLLAAMPPTYVAIPMGLQLDTMTQITISKLALHKYLYSARLNRARIDCEYENQMQRSQYAMTLHLTKLTNMHDRGEVTINEETVAKKK